MWNRGVRDISKNRKQLFYTFAGYFEFRLCEHNDMRKRANQSCFENGLLLTIHETGLTQYDINNVVQWDYFFKLNMPRDVTCTQCILQWKYNAGKPLPPR